MKVYIIIGYILSALYLIYTLASRGKDREGNYLDNTSTLGYLMMFLILGAVASLGVAFFFEVLWKHGGDTIYKL